MFDYRVFYRKYNKPKVEAYRTSLILIKEISRQTEKEDEWKYADYFFTVSNFLLLIADIEESLCDEYFESKSFEELNKINCRIFEDITGENYSKSYANPKVCVDAFGLDIGQILSYTYAKIRGCVRYAYQHRTRDIARLGGLFIDIYNSLNEKEDKETLKKIVKDEANCDLQEKYEIHYIQNMDPKDTFWPEIIESCDLSDLRYLFKLGEYIGNNEVEIAKHLNTLSQNRIDEMAETMIKGYLTGFERANKSFEGKTYATFYYQPGFERVIKTAITKLEKVGLKPTFNRNRLYITKPSKQFEYDHKFDKGLYFDEDHSRAAIEAHRSVAEKLKKQLGGQSGVIVLMGFGEKPFTPESKKENIRLSDEQSVLEVTHRNAINKDLNEYIKKKQWSFTIISYPLPEIGENFEAIFDETVKVNTLDSDMYERVQQTIVDTLDKGDYVHVKGKGTNKTDIVVKLMETKNPDAETVFENCIADVNIPVGEVFTSPVLKGTNGTLHVEEVFLSGLKYENLLLEFEDGFIKEYSCSNFGEKEENEQYIKDNLMHSHKTLPLGEFAIGTNTTAYVMAEKYDIVHLLPILIVEKMGPHFAVGDTCFGWEEDVKIFNPLNGKEMVARENEKTAKRRENVNEAYTNCHTDITLPYSGLESITVVMKDKSKTEIIKDGRFVLEGTEELNKAFD